jgi:hypothetical protein
MDQVSQDRLALVNPVVAARTVQLEKDLGFEIRVTQGKRSTQEQEAIWSQGRFDLATVNAKRAAAGMPPIDDVENVIVTHAPPGHSWHEYGMAVDVVPMTPVPDWDESHPTWKAIVAKARENGLLDGISFHDEPHLQPVELPVSPTPAYQDLLLKKGVDGVWAYAALPALPEQGISA